MARPALRLLARARDEELIDAALRALRGAGWGSADLAVVGPGEPLRRGDGDDVRWVRATTDPADQRNAALRSVADGTEWLILVDAALDLAPGAIEALLRVSESRPRAAIVAGRVADRSGAVVEAGRDFLHPFGLDVRFSSVVGPVARLVDGGRLDEEPRVVDSASTRFALVRVDAVAPLAWWGGAAADFPNG